MKLDHVNMFVDSLKTSASFYCRLFGLEIKEEGTSSKSKRNFTVIGHPEKFYLCLHEAPKGLNKERGLYNHFGIHVDNFDSFVAQVKEDKYKILYEDVIQWPHSRSLYLEGPNGEEIEVSERYGGGLN